jgi:hypothetical protein
VAEPDAPKAVPEQEPPKPGPASPAGAPSPAPAPGRVDAPRVFAQAKPLAPKPVAAAASAIAQRLGSGGGMSPRPPAVAPKPPLRPATQPPPAPSPSPAAPPVAPIAVAPAAPAAPDSPKPALVTTAMSPISSPEAIANVRETVNEAVDEALAAVRSGQRELESRLVRLEVALRELQLSDQARAATFSSTVGMHPAVPPVRGHLPTLPMGGPLPAATMGAGTPPLAPAPGVRAPLGAVTAVMAAVQMPAPAPPPAPIAPAAQAAPLAPVQSAAALAPVISVQPAAPAYVMRQPLPAYDDEPFDLAMLPGGLDGRRRKLMARYILLALLVLGVGGLAVMAIASQAVHGL